jgi:uncharacterized SAM-binding protein YcdF (DUF218 family)
MIAFLYNLRGQVTVQNGLIALLILAYIFNRFQKRKLAKFCLGISIFLFLLCSTSYIPDYLANKLERKYPPFDLLNNSFDTGKVLIHVLGSGYTLDKRLPANAQLGLVALGRLAEGIRLHRLIKNSVIICSGYSSLGLETQAEVTKRAAIVLGVEADKLETLNTPATTAEEAEALRKKFNETSQLVIVTDAIHMPRAMKLFKQKGFNPVAAPTNYKVNEGPRRPEIKWWPSMGNIELMNYIIHEYLGNLKASVFN